MTSTNGRKRAQVSVPMSREVTVEFIKRVQFYECLWNRRAKGYKNVLVQVKAWIALEKEFEIPYTLLRMKWKSLQASFRRYMHIEQIDCDTPRRWYAYHAMQFLRSTTDYGPRDDEMMEPDLSPSEIHVKHLSEPSSRAESPAAGPSPTQETPTFRIVDPRSLMEKKKPPQTRGRTMKRRMGDSILPCNRNMLKVLENVSAVTDRLVAEKYTVKSDGEMFGAWVGSMLDEWSPDRRQSAKVAIRRFLAKKDAARYRERVGNVENVFESSDSAA